MSKLVAKEDAETIRDMIWHEDVVLNTRLSWCCTIQGLLFAALAIAWEKAPIQLVVVLAVGGVVVGASTLYATSTAVDTMARLTEWWNENEPEDYSGPPVIGHRVDEWLFWFLRPSLALPTVFMLLWIAVAVVRHRYGSGNPAGALTCSSAWLSLPFVSTFVRHARLT